MDDLSIKNGTRFLLYSIKTDSKFLNNSSYSILSQYATFLRRRIDNYSFLIDTLHIDDEQITMNLGHAYYQLGNKDLAQSQYQKLVL